MKVPKDYSYDTYFCTRSSSWGWATWADRWNSVDWELENFDKYHILKKDLTDGEFRLLEDAERLEMWKE